MKTRIVWLMAIFTVFMAGCGGGQKAAEPPVKVDVASQSTCAADPSATPATLFEKWRKKIQISNKDPQKKAEEIVSLYANGSFFLPTVWNGPFTKRTDQISYFKHFIDEMEPTDVVRDSTSGYTWTDQNGLIIIDTGLYTFTTEYGVIPARYTFTYKCDQDGWKISSHHSSRLPK